MPRLSPAEFALIVLAFVVGIGIGWEIAGLR
jgi:hypothetical protein